MSSTLLAERPAFPRIVSLPEPAANRAQTIPGSILVRWLTGVMQQDLDGYALIAGSGRTITVLYGNGKPLTSAVTRGGGEGGLREALTGIQSDPVASCFVMTYKLPEPAGRLLSGLFVKPAVHILRRSPGGELQELLAGVLDPQFSGAVVVWSEESIWAVLLVEAGDVCGCYGAEDRTLKTTMQDVAHLLYLDEVALMVHPASVEPEIEPLFSETTTATGALSRTAAIDRTEAAMIAMLSRFEHRLSRIDPARQGARAELARALAEILEAAFDLAGDGGPPPDAQPPSHPLLAVHWDRSTGRIAVADLLRNLEMAAIPDAWLAAADAMLLGIDRTVERQLTWLAVADEMSATTLREALDELLQQARHLLRAWRADRLQPPDSGTVTSPAMSNRSS